MSFLPSYLVHCFYSLISSIFERGPGKQRSAPLPGPLEIARNMQMNIKTERKEDDLWGTIEMSFNNMWFLDSAPSEWKEIWNNLMKEAQRVYIEAKDNMVMYQYYYDLAVEVPCV